MQKTANVKFKILQSIHESQWNEIQIVLFTRNVQLTLSYHLLFSSFSHPREID
jgi:hypothetical protein